MIDNLVRPLLTNLLPKVIAKIKHKGEVDLVVQQLNMLLDSTSTSEIAYKMDRRYFQFRSLVAERSNTNIADSYVPAILKYDDNGHEQEVTATKPFIHQNEITVIEGKAGQGKTTLLRYIAYTLLEKGSKLPVFISLRNIDFSDRTKSPLLYVMDELSHIGINVPSEEALVQLIAHNYFEILLDGFDEVKHDQQVLAEQFVTALHFKFNAPVLVTSRPGTSIMYTAGTRIAVLQDLNEHKVRKLILKNGYIRSDEKEYLVEILDTRPELSAIMISPILVDIFISVYPHLKRDPTTLIEFYSELFLALASKHDKLKSLKRDSYSDLGVNELERLFKGISLNATFSTGPSMTERELSDMTEKVASDLGLQTKGQAHTDIIDRTSLIIKDGDYCEYIHKSVMEYHAAAYMLDRTKTDDFKTSAYEYFVKFEVEVKQVLIFLKELDKENFYLKYCEPLLQQSGLTIPVTAVTNDVLAGLGIPTKLRISKQKVDSAEMKTHSATEKLFGPFDVRLDKESLPWVTTSSSKLFSEILDDKDIESLLGDKKDSLVINTISLVVKYPDFEKTCLMKFNESLELIKSEIETSRKTLDSSNDFLSFVS
ncbi:TPA: NACHT domain-containing NTPase [Vibrio parahaemolyticus]